MARSLAQGDFHLILLGDGIGEDMGVLADFLRDIGARLTLVGLQHRAGPDGATMLLPQIPFRTDVRRQTLYVTEGGHPLASRRRARRKGPVFSPGYNAGPCLEPHLLANLIEGLRLDRSN